MCVDSHNDQRDLLPVDFGCQNGVGDEDGCVEAAEGAGPEAERDEDLESVYSIEEEGLTAWLRHPTHCPIHKQWSVG